MIEGPIKSEDKVRHIETQGVYTVMYGTHDMGEETTTIAKIGEGQPDDTATEHPGWVPCVIYYDENRIDHNFVRDEASFREKFERAE